MTLLLDLNKYGIGLKMSKITSYGEMRKQERFQEKVWLPVFSGHGSSCRFEIETLETLNDKEKWLNYEDAEKLVKDWQWLGDSIGGSGEVVDMESLLKNNQEDLEKHFPFLPHIY